MNEKTRKISQFISLVLRHDPGAAGITLDEHGWADVSDMIKGINAAMGCSLDRKALEEIVLADDKQRYSFNEDHTLIRANQGHSIPVDVELEEKTPPDILYHGTGIKYFRSIQKQGLIPKSRLYVHLSSDCTTAINVGKRHGKCVLYYIDAQEMARDGYKFYLSANGVWRTESVPVKYLKYPTFEKIYSLQEIIKALICDKDSAVQESVITAYARMGKESRKDIDAVFALLTGEELNNLIKEYYAQYKGCPVKHAELGEGELWKITGTRVKIKYGKKTEEYPFPDAFADGTLTMDTF